MMNSKIQIFFSILLISISVSSANLHNSKDHQCSCVCSKTRYSISNNRISSGSSISSHISEKHVVQGPHPPPVGNPPPTTQTTTTTNTQTNTPSGSTMTKKSSATFEFSASSNGGVSSSKQSQGSVSTTGGASAGGQVAAGGASAGGQAAVGGSSSGGQAAAGGSSSGGQAAAGGSSSGGQAAAGGASAGGQAAAGGSSSGTQKSSSGQQIEVKGSSTGGSSSGAQATMGGSSSGKQTASGGSSSDKKKASGGSSSDKKKASGGSSSGKQKKSGGSSSGKQKASGGSSLGNQGGGGGSSSGVQMGGSTRGPSSGNQSGGGGSSSGVQMGGSTTGSSSGNQSGGGGSSGGVQIGGSTTGSSSGNQSGGGGSSSSGGSSSATQTGTQSTNDASSGQSTTTIEFKGSFSKVFAFGDSYTDTGNAMLVGGLQKFVNNALSHTGGNSQPGGRLCDGRLVVDFLCDTLKLPSLPPVQNSTCDISGGVNFAIAGATSLTQEALKANTFVQNLLFKDSPQGFQTQIDWFTKFLDQKECASTSPEQCKEKLQNSLFWVGGLGGDDYSRIAKLPFSIPAITETCVNTHLTLLKLMLDRGAKYIVVQGLPPVGCCPISLFFAQLTDRDDMQCSSGANKLITTHNELLMKKLDELRLQHPDCMIIYADYFAAYTEVLKNFQKYNFAEPFKTCCGGGKGPFNFDILNLCGTAGASTCPDPSKCMSWDGIHSTEAMNKVVADLFFNKGFCKPSFQELLKHKQGMV